MNIKMLNLNATKNVQKSTSYGCSSSAIELPVKNIECEKQKSFITSVDQILPLTNSPDNLSSREKQLPR
jgi:hypothetical protein